MRKNLLLIGLVILLLSPLAAQTVTVSAPNGVEDWPLNSSRAITWTATNPGTATVNIILRTSSGLVGTIQSDFALSAGSWSWAVVGRLEDGTMVAPGTDYIVRIRIIENDYRDDSDAPFTISSAAATPMLQLLSPNGGENWPSGGTRSITWTAANWSGNVQLSLHQNGVSKGVIASVPSVAGTYPWTVGTTSKGSAGTGAGYRVHVSRVYSDMKPHAALVDKSDGDFSIGFPAPDHQTAPLAENIQVSIPEAGKAFEYGTDLCINQGRCVRVPIAWVSGQPGPFQLDLMAGGHVAMPLLVHNDPPASGTTYSTKFLFTTQNSKPGWYRIRVRSTNGKASGSSGKFQLTYKLWDVTLQPKVMNKYHKQIKSYEYIGTLNSSGTGANFKEKPGYVRIGFENHYDSSGSTYSYLGFLFRSRVIFDLSQFKNRKGYFKEAKLQIAGRESHHTAPANIDMSDCDVRFYILAEPWSGGDFFAIPGNLIQNFPAGAPNDFDIPDWAAAWANGASPNHGLLIAGAMEKMNHDNLYCVNYYKIQLHVQFQEE